VFSHDQVKASIVSGNGRHFHPNIIDDFQRWEAKFVAIANEFTD
jgi:response regulator RpfG family c-di-GMP phosphodiesterase